MSDEALDKIAKQISLARKKKQLTQVEVAKKAGMSVSHYAQVERGEKNPSATMLQKIIDALGVTSKDILGS